MDKVSKKLKMFVVIFVLTIIASIGFIPTPSAYANSPVNLSISSKQYSVSSDWRYYTTGEKVNFNINRTDKYGSDRILKFWIENNSGRIGNHVYLETINSYGSSRIIPSNGYYRMRMECKERFLGTLDTATGCSGYGTMDDLD